MGLCGGDPEEQKPSMEPAEFDPTFHGPLHDRYCTDVICCVLFLTVVFGHVILGVVAWQNGHPEHVLFTRNSSGAFCGIGENADKPYLYYFNFMTCANTFKDPMDIGGYQCPTTQLCVEKCPNKVWVLKPSTLTTAPITYEALLKDSQVKCIPEVDMKDEVNFYMNFAGTNVLSEQILKYIKEEKCPFFHIKTMSLMGRCVPDLIGDQAELSADLESMGWGELDSVLPSSKDASKNVLDEQAAMKAGFNSKSIGTRIFEDFAASWGWIVLGLFTSMLVSLAFLLLLRYTAPIMVWSVIGGTILGAAIAAYLCYAQYVHLRDKPASEGDQRSAADSGSDGLPGGLPKDEAGWIALLRIPGFWLALFILLTVSDSILLVMIIFLRERLRIAVAIIQESSKAIGYMVLTLAYPVATFVLVVLCVGFWGVVSLYLVTFGDPAHEGHIRVGKDITQCMDYVKSGTDCKQLKKKCPEGAWPQGMATCVDGKVSIGDDVKECSEMDNTDCNLEDFKKVQKKCPTSKCVIVEDDHAKLVKANLNWAHAYNLFATLWCINFIIALGQCTLAGAFASYYWAFCKPGDIPRWPLLAAFTRTMRYHVGSLAFGSLIITILQILRMILEYVDHKTKDAQNPAIKFLSKCLKCLFWLLEKFLKFLNRNAYIMIAVYGKNFCVSAKNAFFLLLRNIVRVVVLDKVTDMLIFFGKLMVVGTVGTIFYLLFSGNLAVLGIPFDSKGLNFKWMPILTVVVGSYVVASGFFSVYSMCVDTLFLCFLEDLERNDGTPQKPYYMSSNLMNILGKSNQPLKKET